MSTQSPEFFSGKSIPRNMLCPCNSGKKYKKCCFQNKLFEKPPLSVIQARNIRGLEDDVLFRVGYKELPTEYVEKIDNWLEKNKIYKSGCWGNSHILALSKDIDGIDVVNGYYGFTLKDGIKIFETKFKDEEEAIKLLTHNSQFLKQPDKDKGILRIPDGSSPEDRDVWRDDYLDLNTRVLWMRHSWNKIGGAGSRKKGVGKDIHFDLTTEFDKENDSVWTYLNEVETLTSGSIKDVEMLKEKYDEELEDMTTGWDFIAPSGGAEEGQLDTLGFGKYKFYTSTSGGPHFYYNLCDCRYVEMGNTDYPTHDLALKYDGSVKTFSYKPWGSTGGYTTITNGETIDIWNALGAGGQPSTDCFLSSFTPSNLSLSYVNNKPKLAWSIEHPDTNGVYKIYRSVWENGDYSGQTAVWPPVVTVNSWTDEDFTRFRFGNYTIDYEVAYLSLPPNESEKSNQVTTTTGNWSGPLGKTRADKYTLNIFPNPFNSSVTIPLNEEIHTVSIYNILGETIKKYSHVDLISKNQIVWNGLDKYGNEVSTGTYFVILVSDNKIQTRKVVFAK